MVHVATGGVFHLVNDVTLSARTRTDTDDNLVFLDYLHLRVRGSRSEYDPKNEHRYPVFTLGKSPKYGWSVCKLTHYTRKGYIDRLAYIAGNEENICLPEPKDEKRAERTETSVQGGFIIVDYSEKAIAVFGDTKPVKDALHALGGRFNARLTHDGQKRAGWIFQKTKEDEVRRLLGKDE